MKKASSAGPSREVVAVGQSVVNVNADAAIGVHEPDSAATFHETVWPPAMLIVFCDSAVVPPESNGPPSIDAKSSYWVALGTFDH